MPANNLSAQGRGSMPAWPPATSLCLFLDVDGTLLEFASTPDGVSVDQDLIALIDSAVHVTGGAVALVSGRPIAELDRLFAPLRLPAAGVHGYERRSASGTIYQQSAIDESLRKARQAVDEFVSAHHGLLLEDKETALALHYRGAPHLEELAKVAMARIVQTLSPEYELLEGEAVVEIKPSSHDKATAIEAFLREPPFKGRVPVYIGDDLTDYDGFAAVRKHRGHAIAVGDRVSAPLRLENPAAVREWLRAFVQRADASA
jgi:trehalose 6-phosphate phosphatase